MSIHRAKSAGAIMGTTRRGRMGRRNAVGDIREGLSTSDIEVLKSRVNISNMDTTRLVESPVSRRSSRRGSSRSGRRSNDTPDHTDDTVTGSGAQLSSVELSGVIDLLNAYRFNNTTVYRHRRNAVPDVLAILDEASLSRIRTVSPGKKV